MIETIATVDGPMDVHLVKPREPDRSRRRRGAGGVRRQRARARRVRAPSPRATPRSRPRFITAGRRARGALRDARARDGRAALLTNDGIEVDLAAALARLRNEDGVDPARSGSWASASAGSRRSSARAGSIPVRPWRSRRHRARDGMLLEPVLDEADAIDAPLLACLAEDGGIPPADVAAIRARLELVGSGCEVHVYEGAKHAFSTTCARTSTRRPRPTRGSACSTGSTLSQKLTVRLSAARWSSSSPGATSARRVNCWYTARASSARLSR